MSGCDNPPVDKMRDILENGFDFVFAHEQRGSVIVFPVRKKWLWTKQFRQEVKKKLGQLRCRSYSARVLRICRKRGMGKALDAYGVVKVEWVRDDMPLRTLAE